MKTRIKPAAALPADDDAFVRLATVLSVFPVSETTWADGVATGRYPRGYLLGPRVRGWRVGDIRQLLKTTVANGNGARIREAKVGSGNDAKIECQTNSDGMSDGTVNGK